MIDKELWSIVKAAAEGKRVEVRMLADLSVREYGASTPNPWREKPATHRGWSTSIWEYRISPHDCEKDGPEWRAWTPTPLGEARGCPHCAHTGFRRHAHRYRPWTKPEEAVGRCVRLKGDTVFRCAWVINRADWCGAWVDGDYHRYGVLLSRFETVDGVEPAPCGVREEGT